jgi:putative transcriptional regulator
MYFCIEKCDIIMKLNRIKDVLEEKGISQTWLAKKLNKSFNSVNSYVCNRTQPNLETLLQISKILNVDMKDLIADQRQISNDQSV